MLPIHARQIVEGGGVIRVIGSKSPLDHRFKLLRFDLRKVEAESARQFVEASRRMSAAKLRQSRQWEELEDLSKRDTLQRINEWAASRTNGLIPTILDDAPLNGGLVALNAVHFKDRWRRAMGEEKGIGADDEAARRQPADGCKGGIEVAVGARL